MSPVPVSAEPQVLAIKAGPALRYPFLAHPPPQKKRPSQPLPSPPSNAPAAAVPRRFAAIATWAAHVQPGSPASLSPRSPRSPRRRPSITSVRVTSASFLNIAPTPTTAYGTTPSLADFKADLTTVGYTSVFLQLPNTPISANISLPLRPSLTQDTKTIPVPLPSPTRKLRGLNRLRSLSALRSRARSKSAAPSSPTKMKAKAAAVVQRKKAKYAALRLPPLSNELALMQFADGGSMDANIKRVMVAQAKASGGMGIGDVYRDGEGGVWWDQDEEWEYAHLLADGPETGANGTGDLQWITFNGDTSPSAMAVDSDERRGSVSTQDSDLDPRYIVQPSDAVESDDLVMFGSALAPLATRRPAMSVLALPSRPRRTAKHLRKPDYLVDVAFPRSPLSPRSPKFASSLFAAAATGVGACARQTGKARRRPAPLKLTPPSPALKKPTNSPADVDKSRREFLASSFEPALPATPATAATVVDVQGEAQGRSVRGKLTARILNLPQSQSTLSLPLKRVARKKPSVLNMMGLFKSSRKEDMPCLAH